MRDERASVLMLMPAAVLVFIVLGALCVDFASVYGAKRELSNAAAAAANDVASQALDVDPCVAGELLHGTDFGDSQPERSGAVQVVGLVDVEYVADLERYGWLDHGYSARSCRPGAVP